MELSDHRHLLVQEARELLRAMEDALLAIEQGAAAGSEEGDELINALFRAAHTIKGSSGLFGLDVIVEFTHVLESVLARVRGGELAIDAALANLTLSCGDHIGGLIDSVEAGTELALYEAPRRAELLARLQNYLGGAAPKTAEPVAANAPAPARDYRLRLRFAPDVLTHGMDPLAFIRHLTTLGEITALRTDRSALPSLWELDAERCYLAFEVELRSAAAIGAIESVFEFVRDDSAIEISEIAARPVVTENGGVKAPAADRAAPRPAARENTVLKVESRKLDELIDVVGELVTRIAGCNSAVAGNDASALKEMFQGVNQLVEQIRDRSLNLRMVPIGEVFQRFPRLVRDVAQEIGKQIDLTIDGADTELDKSMVEKLADPLVHIVRNAMDHGIETTADRIEAGKPARGSLGLRAYHQSGAVVIEVRDDGRGLDRDRILRKASERGLIPADARLSDREIFELIFLPGFSTAEQVTDLSGRGVGMDVVRRNIDALRGSIDIQSQPGSGTTIEIRLPLTLAIIDAFQIVAGDSDFVLPLNMVEECLELRPDAARQGLFNLRGQPLPCIHLADVFRLSSRQRGASERPARQCLVVVRVGDSRAGLVIDRFVGELQAVIKPLGQLLRNVGGLSGSTILGDGRVALLLDVPALLALASGAHSASATI